MQKYRLAVKATWDARTNEYYTVYAMNADQAYAIAQSIAYAELGADACVYWPLND